MNKKIKKKLPFILAIFISIIFITIPLIAKWIALDVTFKNASGQAANIAKQIQFVLVYPFGKWLSSFWEYIIVFPYWLIIFLGLKFIYSKTKKIWKWVFISLISIYLFLFIFPNVLLLFENKKESISSGTVSNGKIKNAKRVPLRGKNYTTYSFSGYLMGRTYAHSKVKDIVKDAYEICTETCPNIKFLLGEIGDHNGGQFLPHRTHRNGMSVDFMTPLLKNNKRVKTHYFNYHLFNLWGYAMEFSDDGKSGKREIDFNTTAKHIKALEIAADKNGLRIQKIIFNPALRKKMLLTKEGKKIRHLPYTKNSVIIRHDDHYHVDFIQK